MGLAYAIMLGDVGVGRDEDGVCREVNIECLTEARCQG